MKEKSNNVESTSHSLQRRVAFTEEIFSEFCKAFGVDPLHLINNAPDSDYSAEVNQSPRQHCTIVSVCCVGVCCG